VTQPLRTTPTLPPRKGEGESCDANRRSFGLPSAPPSAASGGGDRIGCAAPLPCPSPDGRGKNREGTTRWTRRLQFGGIEGAGGGDGVVNLPRSAPAH